MSSGKNGRMLDGASESTCATKLLTLFIKQGRLYSGVMGRGSTKNKVMPDALKDSRKNSRRSTTFCTASKQSVLPQSNSASLVRCIGAISMDALGKMLQLTSVLEKLRPMEISTSLLASRSRRKRKWNF